MLKGKVINNTGRFKHIFKKTVYPGEEVDLEFLYSLYKRQSGCAFDERFVFWLREHKIPESDSEYWDIEYETTFGRSDQGGSELVKTEDAIIEYKEKLSAQDIANLRVKDNPKDILQTIDSVTKLRRALTTVNKKKGKNFLAKIIRRRLKELTKTD